MSKKFVGVTVDTQKLDDLLLAVDLVEGVEIVHITAARLRPQRKPNIRPLKKPGKLLPTGGAMSRQSVSDPRAVFTRNARGQVVIDFHPTLRNVGLTIPQLLDMQTKLGTLENSLKHSLQAKRMHQRKRATGERRAA